MRSFQGCLTVDWMNFLFFQLEDLKDSTGSAVGNIGNNKHGKSPGDKVFEDDPTDIQRRDKVKEAMIHAWSSYEKYAWGQDELQVCLNISYFYIFHSSTFF